jgi:uncharacterized membrane protein
MGAAGGAGPADADAAARLFGLPFFYWYQLACVLVAIVVVTFIYLMTKGRKPRW